MQKKKNLTWEQIDKWVDVIAQKIKKENPQGISGVYGLPRGGLVPAVMLSHKLGVPLLGAACENCVVVDDIADTGVTLEHYVQSYQIAVLYYKPSSKVVPNFSGFKQSGNGRGAWIVFPWENK